MNDSIERIWRRVLLIVGVGRVTAVESDDAGAQSLQVQLGALETKSNTPRLSEYGFNSNPPVGSDAVVLFVAGERTNGIVVACGNQTYRMRGLASGEVALSDDKGQSVYLSADGIRINGGGLPMVITNTTAVRIEAPSVEMTGDLLVDGDITAGGEVGDIGADFTMAGMRLDYNTHKHGTSPLPVPLMGL